MEGLLADLVGAEVFGGFLIFCRIGAALILMPGIGDTYVSPQIRLTLALLVTAVLAPVLIEQLPPQPEPGFQTARMIGSEIAIGLFIGLLARMIMSALDTAGMMISFQIGIANALVFNPSSASQGSLVSSFLTIVAVTLIFVTDLHHMLLIALADSYSAFPVGRLPPVGDMSNLLSELLARSFSIAFRMAAPFFVFVVIFFLLLGLLNKLMPAVQIFFIALPVQVLLGSALLALALAAMLRLWLGYFEDTIITLIQ